MDSYGKLLDDITEKMDGYAEAGDKVKEAASTYGRSDMAENLEEGGNSNALKRNESMWGRGWLTGAKNNKTQKLVERMGYSGMGDGGSAGDMTYHDDEYGGYHAEYDVMQYGIGGKLRDLTAKTWSYGKTVNTASNDMKNRAETLDGKRKPDDEPKDNQNLQNYIEFKKMEANIITASIFFYGLVYDLTLENNKNFIYGFQEYYARTKYK